MASIFPSNILREHAEKIKTEDIMTYINIIKEWSDDYNFRDLKNDSETTREQQYNQDFFVNILGYTEKPKLSWNFEPQKSNKIGQRPDAIITCNNHKDSEAVTAVVELKGANVALDAPQRREGNMSPVQQAFKYKPIYRHCPFVIVSNFEEFRLYNDNQLDYESWTLNELIDSKDNYLAFKEWFYLLKAENFVIKNNQSKTEALLTNVRQQQEKISTEFYIEYKKARLSLLKDMYTNNESVRNSLEFGIAKAQKVIDRIIFVCFAEDEGLLPDNSLVSFWNNAVKSTYADVWGMFPSFFSAVDHGSLKLGIPNGYNGGLFREDKELNDLTISDDALKKVVQLSHYDFVNDLSVSILGHIFEQSIDDLDNLRKQNNPNVPLKKKKKDKRKEDGIYYTPDYIVKFIVDESLGKYLKTNEDRIARKHKLNSDVRNEKYAEQRRKTYKEYYEFLQNVKVIDPACGSGAFLVYVFDRLYAENLRVAKILKLDNGLFSYNELFRNILQNNIFGVDLNEESVEITRLSLWLKTARKDNKLTALDSNIKCGNSLINDSEVAGTKSFNWETEFPSVFENGGFDVVVGNPPYGAKLNVSERKYLNREYTNGAGTTDTAALFVKLAINKLLRSKGDFGFIIPKSFAFSNKYHENRLEILAELRGVIDCGMVWKEVDLEQIIILVTKKERSKNYKSGVRKNNELELLDIVDKKNVKKFDCLLNNLKQQDIDIGLKILKSGSSISKYCTNYRGNVISKKISTSGFRVIGGSEIQREGVVGVKGYIQDDFDEDSHSLIQENSVLAQNIVSHIANPVPHIKITACIPENKEYALAETINQLTFTSALDAKAAWLLLNSKLINWYAYGFIYGKAIRTMHFDSTSTGYLIVSKAFIANQKYFIHQANCIQQQRVKMDKIKSQLFKRIEANFNNVDINKLSQNFAKDKNLNLKELLKALKKQKIKMSLKAQDEWQEYIEQFHYAEVQNEVSTLLSMVDHKIYDVYGLDDRQANIVESGFKV